MAVAAMLDFEKLLPFHIDRSSSNLVKILRLFGAIDDVGNTVAKIQDCGHQMYCKCSYWITGLHKHRFSRLNFVATLITS